MRALAKLGRDSQVGVQPGALLSCDRVPSVLLPISLPLARCRAG
jgi:hypothetical protein